VRWLALVVVLVAGCKEAPPPPPPFVVSMRPAPKPDAPVLVLLHGYAANEDDLLPIAAPLEMRFEVRSLRALLTVQGQGTGVHAAWFRITPSPEGPKSDPAEVEAARVAVVAYLKSLAPRKVSLLGFSQGATLAMAVAASEPTLVKDVVAIAGRMPPGVPKSDATPKPGVLVLQGTRDNLVSIERADATVAELKARGLAPDSRRFEAGHEISQEMRAALESWLLREQ